MRALATVAALALAISGGMDPRAVVRHIFDMADRDGDGALTRSEYEGAGLARYGVGFDESDRDGDGRTTLDEYLDLYERIHGPRDELEV